MSDIGHALTRKFGPLPAWAWAGLAAGGLYLYREHESASSSTTAASSTAADTTAANNTVGDGWSDASGSGGDGTGSGDAGSSDGSGGASSDPSSAIDDLASAIQAAVAAQTPAAGASASPATPAPAAAAANRVAVGTKLSNGDIIAPYGSRKPTALPGYKVKGLGSGAWVYAKATASRAAKPKSGTAASKPATAGRPRSTPSTKTTSARTVKTSKPAAASKPRSTPRAASTASRPRAAAKPPPKTRKRS